MITITRVEERHAPVVDLPFEIVHEPDPVAALAARRQSLFIKLGMGVALAALACAGYDWAVAARHVTTGDAHVGADTAQVAPRAGAAVRAVMVHDSQMVKRGDVLVRLDDAGGGAQARIDPDRVVLRAPFDGVVSHCQVEVGQRVQAGQTLMVVVPDKSLYVDANLTTGQLAKVHPGQAVTLTSELYGRTVVYHGRVMGFPGGTGAAFAVVRHRPVRIALDREELTEHPLRVGLPMHADIAVTP
jgi:multidrug resistance efflux pump